MDTSRIIAWVQQELDNLDRMIASVEDAIAASREPQRNQAAPPQRTPDWITWFNAPVQEPEIGLWLRENP